MSCESSTGISLVFILGLRPRDKAATLVIDIIDNFLRILYENGVTFPEERSTFVLDHHGRRDVKCKQAIIFNNKIMYLRGCARYCPLSLKSLHLVQRRFCPEVGRNDRIITDIIESMPVQTYLHIAVKNGFKFFLRHARNLGNEIHELSTNTVVSWDFSFLWKETEQVKILGICPPTSPSPNLTLTLTPSFGQYDVGLTMGGGEGGGGKGRFPAYFVTSMFNNGSR